MEHKKTVETLGTNYVAILKAEGFDPNMDDDGDIMFKFEGGAYIIILNEDDPQFFRLCFPSFLDVESKEHREKVLDALSAANMKVKVGKAFLVKDHCWAVVEAFLPDPGYLASVLNRYLRIIQLLVKEVVDDAE